MSHIDCRKCRVHRFKNSLCSKDLCKTFGAIGNEEDFIKLFIKQKGKWINEHENGHGFWFGTCSQCGKENRVNNFCPKCGADMRERSE